MNNGHFSLTVRHPCPRTDHPAYQVGTSLFLQRDFSEQALRKPLEPQFDLSQVNEARYEGFEAGRLAGLAAAAASISGAQARAVEAIALAMADADVQAARVADNSAATLAAALVAAIHAVMPDLIRRSALGEVGGMLAHVLPGLARQPRVDVEVPSGIAEGVATLVAVRSPSGAERIVVRGSEILEPGDVRVSWSAGEARRQPSAVWRAVMDVINATLEIPEPEDAMND